MGQNHSILFDFGWGVVGAAPYNGISNGTTNYNSHDRISVQTVAQQTHDLQLVQGIE